MAIKVYNSLTRKKEEFIPKKNKELKMYVCGVTVYDECHIGHLRSALIFDVIRNYFKYKDYQVTFVKNITDVDDKIIEKARGLVSRNETKDLREAVKLVAEKYTKLYQEDMAAFGIEPPDIEPKATEHIPQIQRMVKGLIDKDYAYESAGSVYFQVDKFKGYGRLSGRSLEQMQAGTRREPAESKRNPLDFALWKASKPEEPYWDSPWGNGRPGWHIECSAMSTEYLGENFDIHAGGLDLIFPHHENEIAQSEAYSGRPFANYWLHNGLLTVNGEKMSKSLNNFITIKDLLKDYNPEEIKLFMLSAHYQTPLDFTKESLTLSGKARSKFYTFFDKVASLENRYNENVSGEEAFKESAAVDSKLEEYKPQLDRFYEQIQKCRADFEEAMDDNFNTARALAALFDFVSNANTFFYDESVPAYKKISILTSAKFTLKELGQILGLFKDSPGRKKKDGDLMLLDSVMNLLINLRAELRKNRQFELADKIRDDLAGLGVVLEDSRGQTAWRQTKTKA